MEGIMSRDDETYYRKRATSERRKAEEAGHNRVGRTHELLADLCDQKAEGNLQWLQIVRGNSSQQEPVSPDGKSNR